jgi:3-phenylpropionate/trans-cinnamate dioxygenase ferredoxin subunit
MSEWIEVCATGDIDAEDVMRFDHAGQTFAIYRSPDDRFYATDGYRTGAAKGAPACVNLKTYPVKVEAGKVLIDTGA